jgi:hypothetical protein
LLLSDPGTALALFRTPNLFPFAPFVIGTHRSSRLLFPI